MPDDLYTVYVEVLVEKNDLIRTTKRCIEAPPCAFVQGSDRE